MKKLLFLFILLFVGTAKARNIVPVPKPDIEIGKNGEIIFKETTTNYITPKKSTQTTTTKKFITKSIDKKDKKEIKEEKKELLAKQEKDKKQKENKVYVKQEDKKEENKKEVEEEPTKKFITKSIDKKDEKEIKEEKKELLAKQEKDKKQKENKVYVKQEDKKEEENKIIKSTKNEDDKKNKKIVITNDNFNKTYALKSDINKENDIIDNKQIKQEDPQNQIPEQKVYTKTTNDRVVKSTNYNTKNLDIISKIEQNLLYNVNSSDRLNKKVEITKGSWSNEDLKESVVKKDFKITKTSKKVEGFDVEKTERDNKIANLKDQAYQAIQLKEYEIAIKLYKEVLKLNSKDNFTKLSLATTYHILGQYTQAKPIYIELLPIFPNSEQLISNLLSIIIQESPYEAIYLLPALANKYSNSAVIQAQTSIAFSSVERYNEAIKYIRNAIYLNEDNIEYKYNLAVLYDITKDYNKAYITYKDVYNNIRSNPIPSISTKVVEDRINTIDKLIN